MAAVLARHHRDRNETGGVDRERDASRVESRNVEPPGPHRLDLRRIRLDGKEDDLLASDLLQMIQELLPYGAVNRWVLHRSVGEHERVRIDEEPGIGWGIGHQVPIAIAVSDIELAPRAALLRRGCGREEGPDREGGEEGGDHQGNPTVPEYIRGTGPIAQAAFAPRFVQPASSAAISPAHRSSPPRSAARSSAV